MLDHSAAPIEADGGSIQAFARDGVVEVWRRGKQAFYTLADPGEVAAIAVIRGRTQLLIRSRRGFQLVPLP